MMKLNPNKVEEYMAAFDDIINEPDRDPTDVELARYSKKIIQRTVTYIYHDILEASSLNTELPN